MIKKWVKEYSGWLVLGIALISIYRLSADLSAAINTIKQLRDILIPFIIGAILAYFLCIPAVQLEKSFLKEPKGTFKHDKARILSIAITFIAFIIISVIIIMIVVPMLVDNIKEFMEKSPYYLLEIKDLCRQLNREYGIPNLYNLMGSQVEAYIDSYFSFSNFNVIEMVGQGIGLVSTAISLFTAIVVAPYIMYERSSLLSIFDHVMLMWIQPRDLRFIHRQCAKVHNIFADFLFGKAVDSLIIGIIAFIGFWAMDLQFTTLLAIVIGVTNMVPFFGPFFGGIPVTFIVVLTSGIIPGVWTAMFIFALQQFDGLILGPYILGESVGVSALWIIFSITFFGGTLGFPGMVIGVPLIASIRVFFHELIRYRKLISVIRQHDLT